MNIDQIKVIFVLGINNFTYKIKEVKQVFIYKKNKKYAFIAVLLDFCKDKFYQFKVYKKATIISLRIKNIS